MINATPRPIEQNSLQANRTVTGTVIEENKEPMIGVIIKVSDTTLGTVTDIDGKYSIIILL
ncbi:carboxypeptidase-like regulatory domain-containing protein [Dysgonomonas alginatilytica]|uniref:carboxypeptidase-like regulatory domain-containing protein n=1 Tax=Dysgonomonas alginatilytica TaxID=1605892 RepID=UPI000D75EA57|nr:carboxypeptidase-like regulatory domain-containing protein [Dysgonomonas alginatilytica]